MNKTVTIDAKVQSRTLIFLLQVLKSLWLHVVYLYYISQLVTADAKVHAVYRELSLLKLSAK